MWRFALCICLACSLLLQGEAASIKKIEAPCTACKAVAAELQRRIDNEPVRNHLDMRHRLDKDGQRYGKVIAYKSSELRAVELLDDLCGRMRDYALVSPAGKRTKFWLKVKGEGAANASVLANVTRPPHQEEEAKAKRLESYCGVLLEELEEELYAGIMKGGFDTQGVEPVLCRGIISACPMPAAVSSAPSDAASSAELVEAEDGEAEEAAAAGTAAGSNGGSLQVEMEAAAKAEL